MNKNEWKIEYDLPEIPSELREAGLSPLLCAILSLRGVKTAEEAHALLDYDSFSLPDPFLMKGMRDAVDRIRAAVEKGETVAVYGDYDVDGITSTCLLTDYLRSKGLKCIPYIPNRDEEGYGVNSGAVDRLSRQGVNLIITVDCGITALEESLYAAAHGIDMVITDHHECRDGTVPEAAAVVDCKQPGDAYPDVGLAGVGVAFKLVCAIEGDTERILNRYADLAAIGTVADVMPLVGENRFLVKTGIEQMKSRPRPGIAAMFQRTSSDLRSLTAGSISFILAPRLNAAGRMDEAMKAAELLMAKDEQTAALYANELYELNTQRQSTENAIWKEALQLLHPARTDLPIVLAKEGWHQGVIGIAASRLAEQFCVPTFMISLSGDIGKGSCRSYGNFNIYNALNACSDLLVSFGGHTLAAGLNIRKENVSAFREALADYYRKHLPEPLPEVVCELLITDPAVLSVENVRDIDLLEPYGNGFSKPVMCMTGMRVNSYSNVGMNGKHLKMTLLKNGVGFDAIFFSHNSREFALREGDVIDIAFTPQLNEFRGNTSVQLVLSALRRHSCEALCTDSLEQGCSHVQAQKAYLPDRSAFEKAWRNLGKNNFSPGNTLEEILLRCPPGMPPETYCICLAVFLEAGLLCGAGKGIYGSRYVKQNSKVVLEDTGIYRKLSGAEETDGAETNG
mgnify:CR=1 FL=1